MLIQFAELCVREIEKDKARRAGWLAAAAGPLPLCKLHHGCGPCHARAAVFWLGLHLGWPSKGSSPDPLCSAQKYCLDTRQRRCFCTHSLPVSHVALNKAATAASTACGSHLMCCSPPCLPSAAAAAAAAADHAAEAGAAVDAQRAERVAARLPAHQHGSQRAVVVPAGAGGGGKRRGPAGLGPDAGGGLLQVRGQAASCLSMAQAGGGGW